MKYSSHWSKFQMVFFQISTESDSICEKLKTNLNENRVQ